MPNAPRGGMADFFGGGGSPRRAPKPILAPVEEDASGRRPYLPTRPGGAQGGLAHTYLPTHLAYGQSH